MLKIRNVCGCGYVTHLTRHFIILHKRCGLDINITLSIRKYNCNNELSSIMHDTNSLLILQQLSQICNNYLTSLSFYYQFLVKDFYEDPFEKFVYKTPRILA